MSTTPPQIICSKCGTVNQAVARFCVSCGTPLVIVAPSSPVQAQSPSLQAPAAGPSIPPPVIPPSAIPPPLMQPPPMPPQGWYPPPQQYYAYAAAFYEAQRREQVDRTGSGLLVIAIGFFLSWVPFVGAVGYLLEIIGAILVIMGRRAFGPKQARNVFWSIIIFIIGIVATVVTAFIILFADIVNLSSPGSSPFLNYFPLVDLVWVGFIGFVEVLLIYELELTTGRVLLWSGLVGSLVTTTINLYVVPNITSGINANIFAVLFLNGLVSLAPAILKGVAYLLARERIVHGDIPTPQQLGR